MFTPAAGWVYGRLNGLDITARFTEGERDVLVDANINPIRYREGWGLAIWGNETLYVKPSPLQLRSVAMLLIILKYGLANYLEFKLFAMNNQPTWTEVENAISIFIRDTLFTPGGLYAYDVEVTKIITGTDINNRTMPVFVGIQPTMDIKTIPVTLGIFNKTVAISF
jgi:phage tail sheath protein FI